MQQRLYVSQDTFFDAIDIPKGAYSTYYIDSQKTLVAITDDCHDDAEIYVDFTYIVYDTSIYEIDRYVVDVETIYNDVFSIIYTSSNDRIFLELYSTNLGNMMIDITDEIPFNENEWIKDLKLCNDFVLLLTTQDRLFAIDRYIFEDRYFDDEIYVEFITENVKKIDTEMDTYILTHSNNVYRIIRSIDESFLEVEHQKMTDYFEGAIIDFFMQGSSVYFVTDNDEIYYCSRFNYISNEVTDEFSVCSKLVTVVPFDLLYQSLLNEEFYIQYNDNSYYINVGNVRIDSDYVSPLNDTEELLISFFEYTNIVLTTEHIYMFDSNERQYIDVRGLLTLEEDELIIDAGAIIDGDYNYKVLLSNKGNLYISNKVFNYTPSDINEFININEIESIDITNIIAFDTSSLYLKLILDNGIKVLIEFTNNLNVESIEYAYPSNLSKVDISFTLNDVISDVFGPTYNESNLYVDQLYTEHVDFANILDSPFRYRKLFYKSNE
jgi:hypothetical protein